MRLKLKLLEKIPAFEKYFGDNEKPHYYSPAEIIGVAYNMGKADKIFQAYFRPSQTHVSPFATPTFSTSGPLEKSSLR